MIEVGIKFLLGGNFILLFLRHLVKISTLDAYIRNQTNL